MTESKSVLEVSLLGPTNLKKFSGIIGKSDATIEALAQFIGSATAKGGAKLTVVFNYAGMLAQVGEAHKKEGGTLRMLYTEKMADSNDWETVPYEKHLSGATETQKFPSWHHMLLSLVSDADIVLCVGLSAGVFAELAYMKWNRLENRGRVKKLIGIKELLRDECFPPEIAADFQSIIEIIPAAELSHTLDTWKNRLKK